MDGSKPRKAYIYDACDAHYKHMCGLKDVDDEFVDSLHSLPREAAMEPDAGLEGAQVRKKARSRYPHALRNL